MPTLDYEQRKPSRKTRWIETVQTAIIAALCIAVGLAALASCAFAVFTWW